MDPKNWNRFITKMFGQSSCLTLDQMTNYIDDRLSEKKRNRIERHLVDCTLCTASIEAIIASPSEKQIKELSKRTHSALEEQYPHPVREKPRYIHYLSIAAVLCFILAPSLYFLLRTPSHEKLFNHYMKPYSASIRITRGEEIIDSFKEAMIYYQKGNYGHAYEILSNLDPSDHPESHLNFYLGIIQLLRNKQQESISYFRTVTNGSDLYFRYPAQWYMGLAYLKMNNRDQAINTFNTIVSKQGQYQQSCQDILKRLEQ